MLEGAIRRQLATTPMGRIFRVPEGIVARVIRTCTHGGRNSVRVFVFGSRGSSRPTGTVRLNVRRRDRNASLSVAMRRAAAGLELEKSEREADRPRPDSCATCTEPLPHRSGCVVGGGDSRPKRRFPDASLPGFSHPPARKLRPLNHGDRVPRCESSEQIDTTVTQYNRMKRRNERGEVRDVNTHEAPCLARGLRLCRDRHDPNTKAFQGKLEPIRTASTR